MRPQPARSSLFLLFLSLSAALSCVLCDQALSAQTARGACVSASDCNVRGTKALRSGDVTAAIDYFLNELAEAEDEPAGGDVSLAVNNLTVAYIRKGDFLMARAWIHEANETDPRTLHNLATIDAHQRLFKWPTSVNGRYITYGGCGSWNELRIANATAAAAKFSFNGVRMGTQPCKGFPAAVGELEGQIQLRGQSGLYRGAEEFASCKITMQFLEGGLSVEEDGFCGMGAGVHTTGDYQRVSIR